MSTEEKKLFKIYCITSQSPQFVFPSLSFEAYHFRTNGAMGYLDAMMPFTKRQRLKMHVTKPRQLKASPLW